MIKTGWRVSKRNGKYKIILRQVIFCWSSAGIAFYCSFNSPFPSSILEGAQRRRWQTKRGLGEQKASTRAGHGSTAIWTAWGSQTENPVCLLTQTKNNTFFKLGRAAEWSTVLGDKGRVSVTLGGDIWAAFTTHGVWITLQGGPDTGGDAHSARATGGWE